MSDQELIQQEIERLLSLHQEAENQLLQRMRETIPNHLIIQRIKKQKLDIKDKLQVLKNKLLPDIIA